MHQWQLQQAKAHLSELVQAARHGEPQEITLRGQPAVVVISVEQYESFTKKKLNLVDFLRNSPLAGLDLDIKRDKTAVRKIEL